MAYSCKVVQQVLDYGFSFLGAVGFGDDSAEKPFTPASARNFNVALGRRDLIGNALRPSGNDLRNVDASADADVAVLPGTLSG